MLHIRIFTVDFCALLKPPPLLDHPDHSAAKALALSPALCPQPSWEPLGASWGHLGSFWGPSSHLGSILGPLGAVLGASLLHVSSMKRPRQAQDPFKTC